MLFKHFQVFVALLAVATANALPEAEPQNGRRTTTLTRTVTSTRPASTTTRTITRRPRTTTTTLISTTTTCNRRPSTTTKTVTVTPSASTKTITRLASTITKTVTFTPSPTAVKLPAYLEVIIHPDALCGTKPVKGIYQNPADDQITVPVPAGGSTCRDMNREISSFSFVRLNAASFTAGCRMYYYSERDCQGKINDGIAISDNENKCVDLPDNQMLSFEVICN